MRRFEQIGCSVIGTALCCLTACGSRPPAADSKSTSEGSAAVASQQRPRNASTSKLPDAETPLPETPLPETPLPATHLPEPTAQAAGAADQAGVKQAAVKSDQVIDQRLREWVRQASDEDVETRAAAAEQIERVEGASALVTKLLGDPSVEVRRGAAYYLLDRFDESDETMVNAFQRALHDPDRMVRQMSLQVVQRLSNERLLGAVGQLGAMLENPNEDPSHRAALARRLAKLERDGKEALPHLVRVANSDAESRVRTACVFAISRVASPEEAVPSLLEIVANEKQPEVRYTAVARLGWLGPQAGAAVEPLCRLFGEASEKIRRGAADALVRIGAPAVPALTKRLASKDVLDQRLAIYALGKIGSPAKAALPELLKLTSSPDQETRELATLVIRVLNAEP